MIEIRKSIISNKRESMKKKKKMMKTQIEKVVYLNLDSAMDMLSAMIHKYFVVITESRNLKQKPLEKLKLSTFHDMNEYLLKGTMITNTLAYKYLESNFNSQRKSLATKQFRLNFNMHGKLKVNDLFEREKKHLLELNFKYLPFLYQAYSDGDLGVFVLSEVTNVTPGKKAEQISDMKRIFRHVASAICYCGFLISA